MTGTMPAPAPAAHRPDDVAAIDQLRDIYKSMRAEIGKVIIGQEDVVQKLLICILALGTGS
jgi:MoxR-like ATPase